MALAAGTDHATLGSPSGVALVLSRLTGALARRCRWLSFVGCRTSLEEAYFGRHLSDERLGPVGVGSRRGDVRRRENMSFLVARSNHLDPSQILDLSFPLSALRTRARRAIAHAFRQVSQLLSSASRNAFRRDRHGPSSRQKRGVCDLRRADGYDRGGQIPAWWYPPMHQGTRRGANGMCRTAARRSQEKCRRVGEVPMLSMETFGEAIFTSAERWKNPLSCDRSFPSPQIHFSATKR